MQAIGLDLFGEGLEDNWTVTAIRAPEGISADAICDPDPRPISDACLRRDRVR